MADKGIGLQDSEEEPALFPDAPKWLTSQLVFSPNSMLIIQSTNYSIYFIRHNFCNTA